MEERGEIKSIKLPSGHRRYVVEDIEDILATYHKGKTNEVSDDQ